MNNTTELLLALALWAIVHFVADFPLQVFDPKQKAKGIRPKAMVRHVAIYGSVTALPTAWVALAFGASCPGAAFVVLGNYIFHGAVDYVTANGAHRALEAGNRNVALLWLGGDQATHFFTLPLLILVVLQ